MSNHTTAPINTEATANNDSGSNHTNRNSRRNDNNSNRNNANNTTTPNGKSFQGRIPSVGAVLALKHERIDKKTSISVFLEKLSGYAFSTYDDGELLAPFFTDQKDPLSSFNTTHKPVALTDDQKKSEIETEIHKEEIKMFVVRRKNLQGNMVKLYSTVWGQCSHALQARLRGVDSFDDISSKFNLLQLVAEVKKLISGIDNRSDPRLSIIESLNILIKMRQGHSESNDSYMERFRSNVAIVELVHGSHVFCSHAIIDKAAAIPTAEEIAVEEERFKAMLLLHNADEKRYGQLRERFRENALIGINKYPKTISLMYELIVSTCPDPPKGRNNRNTNNNNQNSGNTQSGTSLVQVGYSLTQASVEPQDHISPSWILLDTCSTDSVFNNKSFLSNIQNCDNGDGLHIVSNGGSMTYNSTATFDLFDMPVYYNEDSIANVLSFGQVAGLAGVRVLFDTDVRRSIVVIIGGHTYDFKECSNGLYYIDMDNLNNHKSKINVNDYMYPNICLLNTIDYNKSLFSKQQIKRAEQSRSLQRNLGWPGTKAFRNIVQNNLLRNCDITVEDIDRATTIFGSPIPLLRGRMTSPAPVQHNNHQISIPNELKNIHRNICLYIDICYINKIVFLVTRSDHINYITADPLPNRKHEHITKVLSKHMRMYSTRGFRITNVYADGEFNTDDMISFVMPAALHICAADEHVPKIERPIRTLKERCRSMCHSLPYSSMPKIMTIALVQSCAFWINAFPAAGGVSQQYSPSTIIFGTPAPDSSRTRLPFGTFVYAYIGTSNTMESRACPAITLYEGSDKYSYYFMSLDTGSKIHSRKWEELPISDDVILKVESMTKTQVFMPDGEPLFEWSPGLMIDDYDLDVEADIESISDDDNNIDDVIDLNRHLRENDDQSGNIISDDESSIVSFDDNNNDNNQSETDHHISDNSNDESTVSSHHSGTLFSDDNSTNTSLSTHSVSNQSQDYTPPDNDDEPNLNQPNLHPNDSVLNESDDDSFSIHSSQFSLNLQNFDTPADQNNNITSPNRDNPINADRNATTNTSDPSEKGNTSNPSDNSSPIDETIYSTTNNRPRRSNAGSGVERLEVGFGGKEYVSCQRKQMLMKKVTNVVLTQMSAHQGFKKHGERAIAASFKELAQLDKGAVDGKPVVAPINPDTLTNDDKKKALEAVNLIAEKRNGDLKGRTCANGRKQRRFIKPGDIISSPTVSLESILLTLVIDAYEGRYVSIADVPGAYLHAEMPPEKRVLLRLVGKFVDIMCQVNPEYLKYVRYENGKKVLYLRVLRALYGCLESALLWYNLYSTTLVKMGFTLNPYDLCVANKNINGSQCTIAFYVDDNKISHKDPAVVKQVIKELEQHFGKLKVSSGTSFDFLGMDVTIRKDRKVEISMKKQIEEAIDWFGETISNKPVTPANKNLLSVNNDATPLNERKQDIFHSIVAKLLYIAKRGRPDIETTVSFLCTRVARSTIEDWFKLKRVLGFLQHTINDKRIIGASTLQELYTWIDAAYGVHNLDFRSHTGGAMSLGTGLIHQKSSKQKLNVKSSTEAEIVGTSEYMPYNVWVYNFLESQGYKLHENILFQDNQSAIKMETNGRRSCTGNSRHVHIRYFFVKDLIDKKLVRIMYCPTNLMLADFFTKPLQGELFRFFRSIILGHTSIIDVISVNPEMKERVGKWKKYEDILISKLIVNSNDSQTDDITTHLTNINNTKPTMNPAIPTNTTKLSCVDAAR